jgi:hypothetical protein
MIKHLLLLTFLSACFVMGAQAQLKFGIADGYEHLSSTTSHDMTSSGGLSASLLFRYSLCPHWELDWTPSFATWNPHFMYYIHISDGSIGITRPIDVDITVIHITIPLHICYVLPLKKSALFGGSGFFWSSTSMTGGEQSPVVNSLGLSLLAGIRGDCWQIAADYRPWLHNYRHTGEQFDGHLSSDLSIKIGYYFGRVKKKGQS